MTKIAIVGGGAYGTALASVAARAGHASNLVLRNETTAREINQHRTNRQYLPEVILPAQVNATTNLNVLSDTDIILLVTPAQTTRAVTEELKTIIPRSATLVLCAKGIEARTGKRVSEIAREECTENPLAVLSGPSFALDVAKGMPTAVTLAAETLPVATKLAELLSTPTFRPYASNDITGTELGGALKNVIALAVGITRGKGLGASAEAALITRGFAELSRIAQHFGAKKETLTGLSGLGDLILTCSSPQSRNFSYGFALGQGQSLENMKLAEGVHTTAIAAQLCHNAKIDAPIIDAVDGILTKQINIDDAIAQLMSRPLKIEGQ